MMLRDATSYDSTALRMRGIGRTLALWSELLTVFFLLPLFVGLWIAPAWWIPALGGIAAVATWAVRRDTRTATYRFSATINRSRMMAELRRIGRRFIFCTTALVAGLFVWMPERLFDFPSERPMRWLVIVAFYPLVSVYPQELLYRRYFFHRFAGLVPDAQLLWISALSFGWMHLIFRNEITLVLTLVVGYFFADTYRRTGSLRLVCFEHSLYGVMAFTIGLGDYFYHGAIR